MSGQEFEFYFETYKLKNRKFQILIISVMFELEKECLEMFDFGKWRTTELSDPSNSSHFNSEPAIEFMLSPSVELCEKHGALLDIFDPTVELP